MANRRDMENARKNRLEIVKAGLSRRELFKMGLLTTAGYLIPKNGLSAWATNGCGPGQCQLGCSPPIAPFLDPLYIPPVLPARPLAAPSRGVVSSMGNCKRARTASSFSIDSLRSSSSLSACGQIQSSGSHQIRAFPTKPSGDSTWVATTRPCFPAPRS